MTHKIALNPTPEELDKATEDLAILLQTLQQEYNLPGDILTAIVDRALKFLVDHNL